MEKNEIFETAIRELTEAAISKRKETLNDSEQQLYAEVMALSSQAREIVKNATGGSAENSHRLFSENQFDCRP